MGPTESRPIRTIAFLLLFSRGPQFQNYPFYLKINPGKYNCPFL